MESNETVPGIVDSEGKTQLLQETQDLLTYLKNLVNTANIMNMGSFKGTVVIAGYLRAAEFIENLHKEAFAKLKLQPDYNLIPKSVTGEEDHGQN